MKKPVIVALCCLLALSTGTAAFAEEPTPTPAPELVELSPEDPAPQFYPDSISWQEDGGQLLVVKQYSVPYGTVVADLTESGMQWGGSDYTLSSSVYSTAPLIRSVLCRRLSVLRTMPSTRLKPKPEIWHRSYGHFLRMSTHAGPKC